MSTQAIKRKLQSSQMQCVYFPCLPLGLDNYCSPRLTDHSPRSGGPTNRRAVSQFAFFSVLASNKPDSITKTYGKMPADSISKQGLEKFWAKTDLISSRIIGKGQQYAVEGGIFKTLKYIQRVTSLSSDGTLTGRCLVHITHVFLSRCVLGTGMKYTPSCSLSGYQPSVGHVPHAHRLTTFILIFYTNNINLALNC